MCGIAGVIAFQPDSRPSETQLRRMCDVIQHRGPDDYGSDIQQNVGIAMRRLSIIDLSGGHQPIFNEDGTVRVVFNGEIYNYRELRRELITKGHEFRTSSDTEVIVHLWEEYGRDFAAKLNGIFAIALHDMRSNRFILARDHCGVKPLFYCIADHSVVFASEIKALLASGLIDAQLDPDALGQFLAWEYIPGRGTLIKSIRKLEAAGIIEIDLNEQTVEITSYWDIPGPDDMNAYDDADWEAVIDTTLHDCVQRQLVSDVPLGAFLSGGVDSSLIVAHMGAATTFSIGFDDPTYNELAWSQRVAEHLGVDHHTQIIQPTVIEHFDHLMNFMDDPIGDFSIFPTYLVSRLARDRVTVSLSGDGGDELFGGYETYLAQAKAQQWQRIPSLIRNGIIAPATRMVRPSDKKKGLINKAKRFVEGLEHDERLGHARWRVFAGETMRQQLFTPEAYQQMQHSVGDHICRLAKQAGNRSELDRALYIDVKSYLVDNCLVKVDRMSMACSLEVRVPFLDPGMVEMAFRVPSRFKVANGNTKVLLKRIAAHYVPRESVYRPKEGFSIPIKQWLKTEFRPLMNDLLDPQQLSSEGIFDVRTVERLKTEHLAGQANHSHILWSLLVFEDWRRRWKV